MGTKSKKLVSMVALRTGRGWCGPIADAFKFLVTVVVCLYAVQLVIDKRNYDAADVTLNSLTGETPLLSGSVSSSSAAAGGHTMLTCRLD